MSIFFGHWLEDGEDFLTDRNTSVSEYLKNDNSIPGLNTYDVIGLFNKDDEKLNEEFLVREIKNREIIGVFINKGDGAETIYPFKNYVKVCSVFSL